jgi:hypothetical protein
MLNCFSLKGLLWSIPWSGFLYLRSLTCNICYWRAWSHRLRRPSCYIASVPYAYLNFFFWLRKYIPVNLMNSKIASKPNQKQKLVRPPADWVQRTSPRAILGDGDGVLPCTDRHSAQKKDPGPQPLVQKLACRLWLSSLTVTLGHSVHCTNCSFSASPLIKVAVDLWKLMRNR